MDFGSVTHREVIRYIFTQPRFVYENEFGLQLFIFSCEIAKRLHVVGFLLSWPIRLFQKLPDFELDLRKHLLVFAEPPEAVVQEHA